MVIEGYAAVFDKPYVNGWGDTEYIERGAFEGADMSKVVCAFNHNDSVIRLGLYRAGRDNNTLTFEVREKGLWFRCELPESQAAVYESIARGDVEGCSFKFYLKEDRYEHDKENDLYTRYISKISKLEDVGPVNNPAYEDTEVEARNVAEARSALAPRATPNYTELSRSLSRKARVAGAKLNLTK